MNRSFKRIYISPKVEIELLQAEQGFKASLEDPKFSDDEIGWDE